MKVGDKVIILGGCGGKCRAIGKTGSINGIGRKTMNYPLDVKFDEPVRCSHSEELQKYCAFKADELRPWVTQI